MAAVENTAVNDESPLPPRDAIHQAGGGVSGEQRMVKTLDHGILKHLQTLYHDHVDKHDKTWHKDQLTAFLNHVQRDHGNQLPWDLLERDILDFDSFLAYMTSSLGNITSPPRSEDMDFSWPLSNYFISSSHNTYLTGNQLYSESSTDSYKNVLLRGCRCIEIDVWDGDDSDSEGGTSASSSDAEEDDPAKYEKRKKRVETLKAKVPGSLIGKLEKTGLGKRLNRFVEGKKSPPPPADASLAPKPTTTDATAPGASLSRTSTPQAAVVEPRVLHGYTLTKEVSFRGVCEVIRDNAFVASDLPLIVSLEVHCRADQQEIMVNIMEETWKGLLLPSPDEDAKTLPAPGDLRHKILVKVKYTPKGAAATPDSESTLSKAETETTQGSGDDITPLGAGTDAAKKKKKKPSKVIEALSKLGIYTRGVSFKSLTQPEANMPTHVFSLSEKGVMEVHQKSARQLFDHNRHFLMRAYPSGLRIRSSNLDPAVFWRKGIQIVALNWQRVDQGMMLNEGMFAGTGGYVLKPEGSVLLMTTSRFRYNRLKLTKKSIQATAAHPRPQTPPPRPRSPPSRTTRSTSLSRSWRARTCPSPRASPTSPSSTRTSRWSCTSRSRPSARRAYRRRPTTTRSRRSGSRAARKGSTRRAPKRARAGTRSSGTRWPLARWRAWCPSWRL
jgi:hypothetical protein